jgi:hypothetical protein
VFGKVVAAFERFDVDEDLAVAELAGQAVGYAKR